MNGKIWTKDFIFLILSNFLMYVTYYGILSAIPVYLVSDLHATKMQVGIVVGSYTVASVLARPFSGYAITRFGRRTMLLTGLFIYTSLLAGYLAAVTISLLIILRFVHGITWGFTTVSGSTIAVDIIPESKRGEGIGYFALSTTLGMSAGPVIGLFIAHSWGYTAMFITACAVSVVSFLFAASIHLRKRFIIGRHISLTVNSLFDRGSVKPSINVFINFIAYGGLVSFIALYGLEIGIKNSSLYFLIFSLGIASSRLLAGKVFDREGPRRIITFCMLLLIAGFPLLALAKNAVLFYTSAIIIGFGIGVIFPTFQSMINNIAGPEQRASANSTLYTAVDLGMGIGMIFAGFIAQHFSISAIFWINAVICIAGLIFFRQVILSYYKSATSKV